MAFNSNFVHFYPKNLPFLAKKWRSIQDGVLIKSGGVLARIRYLVLAGRLPGRWAAIDILAPTCNDSALPAWSSLA